MRRRGGDTERGFEIVPNSKRRVVGVKLWGMWDVPLALLYRDAVLQTFTEMGTSPWSVLLDARLFPAQSDEVSRIRVELISAGSMAGMVRIASIVGTAVTRLQTNRVAEEGRVREFRFFDDEEEALEWLDGLNMR